MWMMILFASMMTLSMWMMILFASMMTLSMWMMILFAYLFVFLAAAITFVRG
jgi:hypothetical protein